MRESESMRATVCTLGCKVSHYESRAIEEYLLQNGVVLVPFGTQTQVFVINTCTVTAESDRKCRQMIRRAHATAPDACIIVTGCYAQTSPDEVQKIPGVHYIFGSRDKMQAAKTALQVLQQRECHDLLSGDSHGGEVNAETKVNASHGKDILPSTPVCAVSDVRNHQMEPMCVLGSDRTRAYVKIEDGCENKCSYCAIPAARGYVCSKSIDDVVREVEQLVRRGYREVVLTGIEVASWGNDLDGEVNLTDLLQAVDQIEGVERIRLGSIEPTFFRPARIAKLGALSHLTPHFHLSVQSGSAGVLRRMRRKYTPQMVLDMMEQLRREIPDVMFTTDMMAGFPGETETELQETLDFLRRARFLKVHVFPFSVRKHTLAATLPGQLTHQVRASHAAVTQQCADLVRDELLDALILEQKQYPVLFEQRKDEYSMGHTPNDLLVCVRDDVPHGEIRVVRFTRHVGEMLYGEICDGI